MADERCAEVVWTPRLVAAFWDGQSGFADPANYFTAQVPNALAQLIAATMPPASDLLDLGCGPGLIGGRLLDLGYRYRAADTSPQSIAAATDRLAGRAGWLGSGVIREGRIPAADATVDGVLLFETMEHVLADEIDLFCSEIRRVLRPGGRLLVTVPNQEDLRQAMVFCPGCAKAFHRVQHQRSFDRLSLAGLFEDRGFRTAFCAAGDLVELQARALRNPLRWSAIYIARRLRLLSARLLGRIAGGPGPWLRAAFPGHGPHLVWAGART